MTLDLGFHKGTYSSNHVIESAPWVSTSSTYIPTSSSSIWMSSISSSSASKFIALLFSYVVGFGGFRLGKARTGMAGCLPFLSFSASLVGFGFGLGDLGTSANTSATSRAVTSASMSIYCASSSITCSVFITYGGANITLSISAHDFSGKFANAGACLRA